MILFYSLSISLYYFSSKTKLFSLSFQSGKYGEGYIGSSKGVAVHIRARGAGGERDHTGCTWPLLSVAAPNDPLPSEPWIAVIRRGSCNFEIKVRKDFDVHHYIIYYKTKSHADSVCLCAMNSKSTGAIFIVFNYRESDLRKVYKKVGFGQADDIAMILVTKIQR